MDKRQSQPQPGRQQVQQPRPQQPVQRPSPPQPSPQRPAPPPPQQTRETQKQTEKSLPQPIDPVTTPAGKVDTKRAPGMTMPEPTVTVGRAGEKNLALEKFWSRVEGPVMGFSCAYPCGFDVRTLAGNGLEVVMEQLSYKRTYEGTGSLKTQVVPVAPIGTKGRILVRDTTTGETLEQPWQWHLIGGGGGGLLSWLWNTIKRSIWKS